MVPLSHYITTVVASLLTAVNALSFKMNKSHTHEIFWTFLQLLDFLQMEMTNFPAFLYATASEIPTRSYT